MKYKICLDQIIFDKEFSASEAVRLCYKYNLYIKYDKNNVVIFPSKHKLQILDQSSKEIIKIYYINEEDILRIKAEIFDKINEKNIPT